MSQCDTVKSYLTINCTWEMDIFRDLPKDLNKIIAEFAWGYQKCKKCKKLFTFSHYAMWTQNQNRLIFRGRPLGRYTTCWKCRSSHVVENWLSYSWYMNSIDVGNVRVMNMKDNKYHAFLETPAWADQFIVSKRMFTAINQKRQYIDYINTLIEFSADQTIPFTILDRTTLYELRKNLER